MKDILDALFITLIIIICIVFITTILAIICLLPHPWDNIIIIFLIIWVSIYAFLKAVK